MEKKQCIRACISFPLNSDHGSLWATLGPFEHHGLCSLRPKENRKSVLLNHTLWLRQSACTNLTWAGITASNRTFGFASWTPTATNANRTHTGDHQARYLFPTSDIIWLYAVKHTGKEKSWNLFLEAQLLGKPSSLCVQYFNNPLAPIKQTNKQTMVNLPRSMHSINAIFFRLAPPRQLPFL